MKRWGVKDYRSGKHDICTLCKKEKGTLGHIIGHCGVALRKKTESSFNRIAWRHDKVLQPAREKAFEHSKLIKTKGYQLMADLDNRHYEVSIQSSNPTSFSSTNPPKTSLSANLLVQWKRGHETKTKKYHTESQKKDSQSASLLLKLAAEAWLESHCANSSLHWNFRRRLLKKLSPIAQSLH